MHGMEVIADTAHPDFVADLVRALRRSGVEHMQFVVPRFRRVDGRMIAYRPKSEVEFDAIKHLSALNLRCVGCKLWDSFAGRKHWLYPPEWYDHIPNGYVVLFADGHKEAFEHGVTAKYRELGALSFGFVQADCH